MFRKLVSRLLVCVTMLVMLCVGMLAVTFGHANAADGDSTTPEPIDMSQYFLAEGFEVEHGDNTYKLDENGKPYREDYDTEKGTKVTIFAEDEFKLEKGDEISIRIAFDSVKVLPNQEIQYTMNPNFLDGLESTSTEIYDGNTPVGMLYITTDDGLIRFVPDADYVRNHQNSDGTTTLHNNTILITGSIGEGMGNDPNKNDDVIYFGDVKVQLPMDYSDYNSRVGIVKSEPEFDPANKTLTYTVTVTNNGEETAQNVKLVDSLEGSKSYYATVNNKYHTVTYTSIDTKKSPCSFANDVLTWYIKELAAGESATIIYNVKLADSYFVLDPPQPITNTATVTWGTYGKATTSTSGYYNGVLNIAKGHSSIYTADDGTVRVKYYLTVTAPSTNQVDFENIYVQDTVLNAKTAKLVSGYEFTAPDGTSVSEVDAENGSFKWNIRTVKPGQTITLKYEVIINVEGGQQASIYGAGSCQWQIYNTATVYQNNDDGTTITLATSNQDHVQVTKAWISKTGNLKTDGSIHFTVNANQNNYGVAYITGVSGFTDTIESPYKISSDYIKVTAKKYINGTLTVVGTFNVSCDEIDKTTGEKVLSNDGRTIKFYLAGRTFDDGLYKNQSVVGAYNYVIEYDAESDTVSTYKNNATLYVGNGDGNDRAFSASYSGTNFSAFTITKTYQSGVQNMKWQTVISSSYIPVGATFKDCDPTDITSTGWYEGNYIEFTQDQLDHIQISNEDGTISEDCYEITPLRNDAYYEKYGITKYRGFQLTFTKEVAGPVTIACEYTANLWAFVNLPDFQTSYRNAAQIAMGGGVIQSSVASTSSPYYYYTPMTKTAGEMNWETNELSWYIELNRGSYVKDGYLYEYIMDGLEFESAQIAERGSAAGATQLGEIEFLDPTDEEKAQGISKVVKIPVTGLYTEDTSLQNVQNKVGAVTIEVITRVVDADFLYGSGSKDTENNADSSVGSAVTVTLGNKAKFVENGTGNSYEVSADTELTNTPLTKSVNVTDRNTRPYLLYTLEVNPNGLDYLADSAFVTVVDDMSENMSLAVDDSHRLQVTTVENGETKDITDECTLKLKDEGHGFYLDVPDATPVTITYYVALSGYEGQTIDISNKAYFKGSSNSGVASEIDGVKIIKASATMNAGANFYIQKSDYNGEPIEGVTFRVSRVTLKSDGTAEVDEDGEPVLETLYTGTTDADGKIYLRPDRLQDDKNLEQIYVMEEISAPDGYEVDTDKLYLEYNIHPAFEKQFKDKITVQGLVNGATIARYNEFVPASLQLAVNKTLTARDAVTSTASGETFTFTLTPSGDNAAYCYMDEDMKIPYENGTVTITGAGTVTSDPIYFTKSGTYTITLVEDELTTLQEAKGYTRDASEYTITVKVENSADQTGLVVSDVKVSKDGVEIQDSSANSLLTFDNGYKVSAGLIIPVEKDVEGIADEIAAGKAFSFSLYAADEHYEPLSDTALQTVQVTLGDDGTGEANFGTLLYITDSTIQGSQGSVGTYYYIIKETGSAAGFVENTTVHKLKVIVSDDGTDSGKLTVVTELDDDAVDVSADNNCQNLYTLTQPAHWTNTYVASGSLTLQGTKRLVLEDGSEEALEDRVFSFEVRDADGNVVSTGSSNADGVISFEPINYSNTDVGQTYTYTVTERAEQDDNIIYSDASFQVEVTITDNGDGTLTAQENYPDGGIVFENVYIPDEFYSLPNTGGMGTKPFTFSGTALIMTASLMYISIRQRQKHKRKGGANPQFLHSGQ